MNVRLVTASDVSAIEDILNKIELFPAEMLNEMISDYLVNPQSTDVWLVAEDTSGIVGFVYSVAEKLTVDTYNLLALGVNPARQGQGIGGLIVSFTEEYLKSRQHRLLIIDTSGTDDFRQVRDFYEKLQYKKEAVIADFWDTGDDKVTYTKLL